MATWVLRIFGWCLVATGLVFAELVPIVAVANWWQGAPQIEFTNNLILFGFFVALALIGYGMSRSASRRKPAFAGTPTPAPLAKSDKLRRWQQRA
ncbi:MAG: hypothetical protein AAGA97_02625 [Pseudomonadota bacterium]